MKIETATKIFKVHKNIVCPASPFFHAACTSGFRETTSGHIKVGEDEQVIEVLIRHMYELEVPHLSFNTWSQRDSENETTVTSLEKDARREAHLRLLLSVIRAADKVMRAKFYRCTETKLIYL